MKSFRYKYWFCEWNDEEKLFYLYTPSEMEQPKGFRYPEMEVSTKEQVKEFINNY